MSAIAACQLVSGIADLDIVDDAGGDARAADATADTAASGDSTVEAAPDVTAETAADTGPETAADGPVPVDGGPDADAGPEAGPDAADAAEGGNPPDAADAADAGDASDAADASDAGDASDGPVEGGCQFGWQCPAGACTAGVCVEPPSCQGVAPTCGPGGNEDCCKSIVVPAGDGGVTFFRSFDPPNYTDASTPATLAGPFALDKFEVTVERFEKFVAQFSGAQPASGAGAYPPVPGTGWDPSWPLPASQAALISAVTTCPQPFAPTSGTTTSTPHLPMNCVEWYIAFAFCAWDGSRLPTEAEWNFAAAGGAAQRMFPWLVGPPQIDSTYAWYNCTGPGGTMEPGGGAGPCTGGGPFVVGSESPKGDALWGHVDMAGSMMEPTLDYSGPYPVPCTNCVDTTANPSRVYRGGSFVDPPPTLDTGYRSGVGPTFNGANLGIRCAR